MAEEEIRPRGILKDNWVEENAVAALNIDDKNESVRLNGHEELITINRGCKMETLSVFSTSYIPLKSPGLRVKGVRKELLEKHLSRMMREKILDELKPVEPELKPDYRTTQRCHFCAPGFFPSRPEASTDHNYRNEDAITFWSDNVQNIQRVSTFKNPNAPFKKSSQFSTRIQDRLDEEELPDD
ncbi:sperm-associated antigen 8 [Poecilia reticulata]|uniref:Sperm-associated antigen 8-like n=1 Tax=Poecilia reticulata TaxID=8081 RepID=A0A3P9Q824_POERE|nr:PREDICTED: sperm-associated antigen 8-like [Poecilia reticulata]